MVSYRIWAWNLLLRLGWVGGWVAGEEENKAISAFIEVEVEVEAELGNMQARAELKEAQTS